jgi:hypothetical protein
MLWPAAKSIGFAIAHHAVLRVAGRLARTNACLILVFYSFAFLTILKTNEKVGRITLPQRWSQCGAVHVPLPDQSEMRKGAGDGHHSDH